MSSSVIRVLSECYVQVLETVGQGIVPKSSCMNLCITAHLLQICWEYLKIRRKKKSDYLLFELTA